MNPHSPTGAVPRHIAIIMDGNGRWAKARMLPRSAGHLAGVETVRRIIRHAREIGVEHLTLYAFSSENWSRPPSEVGYLLGLLRAFIRRDVEALRQDNVRIRLIGGRDDLESGLSELFASAEAETAENTGLRVTVAFNYGSRQEIAHAAQMAARAVLEGKMKPEDITPDCLSDFMYTAGSPDPDLLIRTSGEKRISNFLLWQCAYTEFVFVPEAWPDFTGEIMDRAIGEYMTRERRFGGLPQASAETA
ncbi:MAG: isoprenyl transferase [Aestuariivirgaceae bacterium]|nr:isoprenyl transferase [Aestuariivirgaceae bacterium]